MKNPNQIKKSCLSHVKCIEKKSQYGRTVVVPHKWPIFGSKLTLLTFPMIIPRPNPITRIIFWENICWIFLSHCIGPLLFFRSLLEFPPSVFLVNFLPPLKVNAGHIEYHPRRVLDMESANSNCVVAENPGPWNLNLKRSVSKYFDHVPSAFCRRPRPLPTSWLEKDVSDLWSHRRNTSSVLGTRLSNPWFSNIRTGRNFQDRRAEKRTNH